MLKKFYPKDNKEFFRLISVVIEQACMSITGLLTTVVAARVYDKTQYANLVLLFSITVFVLGFQSAIISKPYAVNLNDFENEFTKNYYRFNLEIKLLFTVVVVIVFPILYYVSFETWNTSKFLFFLFYILSYISYYFVRETLLSERKTKENLFYAIACSVGLSVLLIFIFFYKVKSIECFLFGASLVYSFLCLFYLIRNLERKKLVKKQYKAFWLSNWKVGKWLLGSNFLFHISSNIYPWLLLYITSKDNVAVFGVLVSAASLVNPLLTAFSSYLLPIFVRVNKNYKSIQRNIIRWLFVFGFMSIILVITGFFLGEDIVSLLYGEKYKSIGYIVFYPFVVQAITVFFQPYKVALIAIKRTDVNFWILIPRCIITITLGYILISRYQIFGVFYTMIIENLFYQTCSFVIYKRVITVK